MHDAFAQRAEIPAERNSHEENGFAKTAKAAQKSLKNFTEFLKILSEFFNPH